MAMFCTCPPAIIQTDPLERAYAGQQRQTMESMPDFIVKPAEAIKTGTDDCATENHCPKTAHQSERKSAIPNNFSGAIVSENSGFDSLNLKENGLLKVKKGFAFLEKKQGKQVQVLSPRFCLKN
jgi:hypothetical protein